jgi:hypothetical protein
MKVFSTPDGGRCVSGELRVIYQDGRAIIMFNGHTITQAVLRYLLSDTLRDSIAADEMKRESFSLGEARLTLSIV